MKLEPNVPVDTEKPTLLVEGLEPGVHRFQLEVLNDKGAKSEPAIFVLEVSKDERVDR
ncbi:MAG TPA: hypothetical protein VHP37_19725 [Burkholderiales bacterium]|nr:hypothetical protein [Burkholderiales bacterium]